MNHWSVIITCCILLSGCISDSFIGDNPRNLTFKEARDYCKEKVDREFDETYGSQMSKFEKLNKNKPLSDDERGELMGTPPQKPITFQECMQVYKPNTANL